MDPDNPSQPTVEAAYNISGNPVDQNQAERRHAESGDTANSADLVEARERGDVPLPSTHGGGGQPSSLGYGDRGSARDEPDSDVSLLEEEAIHHRIGYKLLDLICYHRWVLPIPKPNKCVPLGKGR